MHPGLLSIELSLGNIQKTFGCGAGLEIQVINIKVRCRKSW